MDQGFAIVYKLTESEHAPCSSSIALDTWEEELGPSFIHGARMLGVSLLAALKSAPHHLDMVHT